MAVGVIKALHKAGLKVPDDVAVIGIDNIFIATLVEPSLSTIDVPRYEIGCESVRLLIEHLNHPEYKPQIVTLECELIVRNSTVVSSEHNWDLSGT